MAEEIDDVAQEFAKEVAPASRPRDQQGKFIRETQRPEPMFQARAIEGDPLTGDTRDAGDDPRYLAHEREIADGEQGNRRSSAEDEGQGNEFGVARREGRRHADADDGLEFYDEDPENIAAEAEQDSAERQQVGERDESDEGAKYEVTVDGETHEVSLKEALRGYVRQATFHQRAAQLTNVQHEIEVENGRLNANWQMWHKARVDFEEDLQAMIPPEPNWDQLFAANPQAAHQQQKIYQQLYGVLNRSRQLRAEREALDTHEANRRLEKYAVEGFARFVQMSKIPDEPTLKKEIQSMRRSAVDAGFSEYEVATVYDPRMLIVLRWASKYRRMMATRPRAIEPSKGRTLTPGAATPFGNARRSGFDDAQRKLAQTGRVSDAAEVFRRLL